MHDPGEWRLKHHGDAGANGNYDHYPVQICNQSQQITEESIHAQGLHSIHSEHLLILANKNGFCDSTDDFEPYIFAKLNHNIRFILFKLPNKKKKKPEEHLSKCPQNARHEKGTWRAMHSTKDNS